MKSKRPFLSSILAMLCVTSFLTACVIKIPFQNQASEKEVPSKPVKAEKPQKAELESKLKNLQARLETFKSELKTLKKETIKRSKNLKKELISLEEARTLAEKMGDQIEKTYKDSMTPLKDGYKDRLKKSNQKIALFQKQLKEGKKNLLKLKREITNKINALLPLEKKSKSDD